MVLQDGAETISKHPRKIRQWPVNERCVILHLRLSSIAALPPPAHYNHNSHHAPIYKKCSPTYQTPITSFANGTSSAAKIGTQTSARILTPKSNAESGCTTDDGGKEVTKSLCFAERLGEERGREVLYPKVCLMLLT